LKTENVPKKDYEDKKLGLPELTQVTKEKKDNTITWDLLESKGISMDHEIVMHPFIQSEKSLERIYINMDSTVLLNYKKKIKNANEAQLEFADRKYISAIYFHTLFLFMITVNKNYSITKSHDHDNLDVSIEDYLIGIFTSHYSEFLLNFGGMEEMIQGLSS
jgi:hypothetical protein